jgi:ribosomal protein S18 acetylase RimI-like enzyme
MPGAADGWGTHTAGLIDLEVAEGSRRQGLASMLLAEAFRALGGEGAARVEVQTMQHNTAALALYQKLGFTEVDEGIVYRQQAS